MTEPNARHLKWRRASTDGDLKTVRSPVAMDASTMSARWLVAKPANSQKGT